jgi:hypothetical protein
MQRLLIITGLILIIAGVLWPWLGAFPLGRLPGDIVISRPNLKLCFPITTMVVISLAVSLILWLFRR